MQNIAPRQNPEALEDNNPLEFVAVFKGQKITELPKDLYIPPEALEVFLEAFEGPLDLLLYLIRKQNLDVLDIPIADVTRQYMEYVELMQELHLELAAEYLVMAAMLAEIKSRMLLPKVINEEGEEVDPRAELIRRLQEYERFKKVAEDIDELPRIHRDVFTTFVHTPDIKPIKSAPKLDLQQLIFALRDVFERAKLNASHHIKPEVLSVRERMTIVLERVTAEEFIFFGDCFDVREGRMGIVVTFIAILELLRLGSIEMVQSEPFAPIYIKGT